ncbi:LacI family transcriptional regulator, partial [Acinetobacter baumannii]|nr:LacI family transcriptional regulator [Acinetobacter baumannii]
MRSNGAAFKPIEGAKLASISSVAKHAGVSIATVSRVLNGTKAVADDTRARVEAS